MTIKILEEISSLLPSNADITTMAFEGANIILYTKNKDFFLNNTQIIREIVSTIKKRVELRPDPSLPLDLEKAEIEIKKILPQEVGKQNIIFDPQRSQVVIEVEKPGMAIGKSGEVLRQIKEKTLWVPLIRRIPSIRSQIIENIRQVLYENNDYRKKFLNKVGERIYGPKRRNKKTEWVRITCLGAGRQVGRSCFLLQTPESNILLDCGQNVAAPEDHAYPYFDAPELKIEELDAVIVSHAHVDHCLAPGSQVLLKGGAYKSIEEVKEGDQLMTVNWKKGILEPGVCVAKTRTKGHKKINIIKTPYSEIEASPNHKFFKVENLQLKEIESQDLKINDLIPLSTLSGKDKIKPVKLNVAIEDDIRLPLTNTMKQRLIEERIKRGLSKNSAVFKEDLIPMSAKDVRKILIDTRIVGRVHNSPRLRDLPSSILDWYRRNLDSYATRKTVKILLNILEHRVDNLYSLRSSSKATLKEIRQNLSLSQYKMSQELGISLMQVQYREEGYTDAITELLEIYILKELELTALKTEEYINKIKQILAIPVTWSRIISIESKDNPHDHLVDIEVSPNRNFIANGNVVHNSSLVPLLFKYGYNGPVYCTAPTRDISALLALDIIAIAQKDARKMLYSSTEIKDMVKHTITLDYEEVTDITPDVRLTFYDAGHILGSALVHLHIGEGMHNFVYSLDGSTKIPLIDMDNKVKFVEIGEFIDNQFNKKEGVVVDNGFVQEKPNVERYATIAFNPKTLKSEIVPITSFVRHPINEEVYKIKTESGREIVVTQSHSIFTARNGQVTPLKVSELKPNEFIVGARKIPSLLVGEPIIDLLPHADKLRLCIGENKIIKKLVEKHKAKAIGLKENDLLILDKILFDHYKGFYKKDIKKKYHIHERRVVRIFKELGIGYHSRVKTSFPDKLRITKDLARFLGYYISEGYSSKKDQVVSVTNYNDEILQDCYEIVKKELGIEGTIDYKHHNILFNSKQLKIVLSEILKCGKGAYSKRVPQELLLTNKEVTANLLYGLFSGDGGIRIRKKGREINYGSKSQGLIQDITFLLLQFGLVPRIEYNRTSKMHNLYIYNKEKIVQFLEEIGINNSQREELVGSINLQYKKASFDMRIPIHALLPTTQQAIAVTPWQNAESCGTIKFNHLFSEEEIKLVNSDLLFDKVKSIEKIKPTRDYVYDLRMDGYENFLGGEGFLFMHNTGDFNYELSNLLAPASTQFPRLETLMLECTYGTKEENSMSRQEAEDYVVEVVQRTLERGGKVLFPVLGVGRSQELMVIFERLMREGRINKVPMYVQGLVWDINAIHTAYPDFYNNKMKKQIFHQGINPFTSEVFKQIGSKKEMQEIMESGDSCIILATSGMLTGGASVEYFKMLCENPKHALILTSYQGEGSLGRRLENGEKEIGFMVGENKQEILKVNMEIHSVHGFTGHSNYKQLIGYIKNVQPRPKKIIFIHGESSRCLEMSSTIHKMFKIETLAPKNLETIRLR